MPTTRSAAKQQTSLGSVRDEKKSQKRSTSKGNASSQEDPPKSNKTTKANSSAKRKAPTNEQNSHKLKKAKHDHKELKQTQISEVDSATLEKPIIINRSPVLQLWAATVANFLHPDESWSTCLSIGGSIATLCAISKGRAIGKVEPKDDSTAAQDKRKKRQQKDAKFREVEVMGFPMHVKDNVVVVDGKPKPLNENSLRGKFGEGPNYDKAKTTMEEALQKWADDKDELNKAAFHMYEQFRPNTRPGASGWGRKGELNLQEVRNTIGKR